MDNLVYGHLDAVLCEDFLNLDLSDQGWLDKVVQSYPIDGVIHFAAYTYVEESVRFESFNSFFIV